MKKELDKELYPEYKYPSFTPDPSEPFREPIAKLGKMITDRIPQKLGTGCGGYGRRGGAGPEIGRSQTEDTAGDRKNFRPGGEKM